MKPYTWAAMAALIAVFGLFVSGCTVLKWGGGDEVEPLPDAKSTFNEAEQLFAEGKYKEAREVYEQVKTHDPERFYDPLVQIRLGDSYYEEGRFEEAEVEYQRFIDLRPKNKAAPYVKYQMGMCYFKRIGDPDRDPAPAREAATQFSALLKDYPGNPYEDEAKEKLRLAKGYLAEHEYSIGHYYYRTGEYKAAIGRFRYIRENYPGSRVEPETLYYLADSYIELEMYKKARETLAILNQEYPNNELNEEAKDDLAPRIPE